MKKYVLIHLYKETHYYSIIAFSDSFSELDDIMCYHPSFGSSRHEFFIVHNIGKWFVQDVKDECLINICKNVAQYLSVFEYAMLKKSYFKASAWFEKAKNSASLAADILDNY